jgi:hypothetical protein
MDLSGSHPDGRAPRLVRWEGRSPERGAIYAAATHSGENLISFEPEASFDRDSLALPIGHDRLVRKAFRLARAPRDRGDARLAARAVPEPVPVEA